ncbi:GSCFA domain-containing protein [Cyanobium sp. NIES-981]|uniref:GSCFA domain-containing protein n=1 Tax=Cyanobium sp. NIES-981 TaxID=1851505 RepID=UPI0007DD91BD|nr:GSCFA domain-containing protein [Cyanobium sp. NIES-981]SBO43781.1 conserved protein of unknown function [Cyanobium sp. NIES-981]
MVRLRVFLEPLSGMGVHPYADLPPSAFWKSGVSHGDPHAIQGIYRKKFDLSPQTRIATAGSCFAQHITRRLAGEGLHVLDVEPAPSGLPTSLHQKYGFSLFSARYGNIYTVRQLLQLAEEVAGDRAPQDYVWERNGRYFDALRPGVEPEGLDSPEEVVEHRRYHIAAVKKLFQELDLIVFTLGLTESWEHRESGTVYPMAPGTFAGKYDPEIHAFRNSQFPDVIGDFNKFQVLLRSLRQGRPFKVMLTVSPVPLTASASGHHVLVSSSYSKAILRSVAGQLADNQAHIDYFPSYEIVTNPKLCSSAFAENLRSVRESAVDVVMEHFFSQHAFSQHAGRGCSAGPGDSSGGSPGGMGLARRRADARADAQGRQSDGEASGLACDEMILDAFAPRQ